MPRSEATTGNADPRYRITVRLDALCGRPFIRDMRSAVEHVLGVLAAGESAETIRQEYSLLELGDIQACPP